MIENAIIDVPCPNCGEMISVSIKQIENNSETKCSKCGVAIKLTDRDGALSKIDYKIANIFKRLGK